MPAAIYVLGLSIFCLGTTEFMISGLLPILASDLHISIPQAGWLISAFALAIALGAPPLSLLSLRWRPKTALLALLFVFIAGQILAAIAPTYAWLMAARIITALAFGPFFAVGAVAAVDRAGEAQRGRAISVMFGGLTIANVLGVPTGAFIAEQWGWRGSFWAVAAFATISLICIARVLPGRGQPEVSRPPDARAELVSFRAPVMWSALATTALSQAALFALFSYIAPLLTEVARFSSSSVPAMLVLFGVGSFVGSYMGGRFADRFLDMNLLLGLVALSAVIGAMTVAARSPVATTVMIFVFGVAAFAINPALQAQVMQRAKSAPTLASSVNISAFNVGNTTGPWLGGLAIAHGYGYLAPAYVGVALALAALAASAVTIHLRGKDRCERCARQ